jgi:sterol desaturase/sphingolipid hydroxylase (fatty acid hydroxylase superfamily)
MVAAVLWFLVSAALVDLAGYWLHRWVHRRSAGPMHRAHMTHHLRNYPPGAFFSDRYRSAGADSLAVWLAPFGMVYAVAWLALGLPHPVAALVGGAVSAGLSSVVHDLTHILGSVVWHLPLTRGMAVRHHAHHFQMRRNYGVLTDVWDRLFRTRRVGGPSRRARPPRLPGYRRRRAYGRRPPRAG